MACCLVTVVVSGLVKLEPSIGQNE
jgi:hypothetical protein